MRPASVIIVSRHRCAALLRCITALRQQDYPLIEVIVVADSNSAEALHDQRDVKIIAFDQPNISAARNLGLAQAAGDIALFIDDDAVAEPTWASRLIAPFDNISVVASTGFVRGRNGISFQWRACMVDHLGADHPIDVPDSPSLHAGHAQRAVKTQGTNCAFRADVLRAAGGFDPAFAFYLDEADVNLRLAPLGHTAIVPGAQVHHSVLESDQRSVNRIPRTLFDIAASTAVFLRKHASAAEIPAAKADMFAAQSARIAALRRRRKLTLGAAQTLRASLDAGWQAGVTRSFGTPALASAPPPFCALGGVGPRAGKVLAGRIWNARALHRAARVAQQAGVIVTVICLSPTIRRHRMQFLADGYWWQSGGLWGRAVREQPESFGTGFRARVSREAARIASVRPIAAEGGIKPPEVLGKLNLLGK